MREIRDRILLWNDDNHEPSVWINGEFLGNEFITILKNVLKKEKMFEGDPEVLEVYPWDYEEELEEGEADILFEWFQSKPNITKEQLEYIFNNEWRNLGKSL